MSAPLPPDAETAYSGTDEDGYSALIVCNGGLTTLWASPPIYLDMDEALDAACEKMGVVQRTA